MESLKVQRLIALFFLGWALFNFPLLGLWDWEIGATGVPVFPLALFLIWAVLIAALAWLSERDAVDEDDDRP